MDKKTQPKTETPEVRETRTQFAPEPRNGQWVKFDITDAAASEKLLTGTAPFPPAFQAADGRFVGIYCHAGRIGASVVKPDGTVTQVDEWQPARIEPVDLNGAKVHSVDLATRGVVTAKLDPKLVTDLAPVTSRDDIPPVRLATYEPDWVPQA